MVDSVDCSSEVVFLHDRRLRNRRRRKSSHLKVQRTPKDEKEEEETVESDVVAHVNKNGCLAHRGVISSGNVTVGGNMAKSLQKYHKRRHPHNPTKNVVVIKIRKRE